VTRVVSLDLEAKPYANPQDVRIQLSGNPCRVPSCGYLAGDGYVCPTCVEEWEVHLGNVAALVEDLELAQIGRVKFGTREGNALVTTGKKYDPTDSESVQPRHMHARKPGRADKSIPVDDDDRILFADPKMPVPADDQTVGPGKIPYAAWASRVSLDSRTASYWLDRLRCELVGQIRLICEVNTLDIPKLATTVAMSRWLLGQCGRIAYLPEQDGWGMVHDLDQVYRDCVDAIDSPARRKYVRVCDCGLSVWARDEKARCACGKVYDVTAEHDARVRKAEDYLVTVNEAINMSGVKRGTLRSWMRRGRLEIRTQEIPVERSDGVIAHMVQQVIRYGDVVALNEAESKDTPRGVVA